MRDLGVHRRIGYQVKLGRRSERRSYGVILEMRARSTPAKYNRYVITDRNLFKTTAIDRSAILRVDIQGWNPSVSWHIDTNSRPRVILKPFYPSTERIVVRSPVTRGSELTSRGTPTRRPTRSAGRGCDARGDASTSPSRRLDTPHPCSLRRCGRSPRQVLQLRAGGRVAAVRRATTGERRIGLTAGRRAWPASRATCRWIPRRGERRC
jgi:hypothetical protein